MLSPWNALSGAVLTTTLPIGQSHAQNVPPERSAVRIWR
jgi:hypothetical protein